MNRSFFLTASKFYIPYSLVVVGIVDKDLIPALIFDPDPDLESVLPLVRSGAAAVQTVCFCDACNK